MANSFIFNGMNLPKALDKDETLKLFEEYKNGSFEARNKIVEHNMRLVASIVSNKVYAEYADKELLFSIGCEGLIKAVETFDLSKNIVFSTYATTCIYNEILMYLRKHKNDKYFISMETTIGNDKDGNEKTLEETLYSPDDLVIDYENSEIYSAIRDNVEKLDERTKKIIKLYYGFDNLPQHNQAQISDKLGISQSYVCRIISSTLEKIGNNLKQKNYIEKTSKDFVKNAYAEKEKKKVNGQGKKLSEFLGISDEILKNKIKNLTDEQKQLLLIHYSDGFDKPAKSMLSNKQKVYLYNNVFPRLKGKVVNKHIKKSLCDYLGASKEELEKIIINLKEDDQAIISIKYPDGIDNASNGKLNRNDSGRFFGTIVPYLRRRLSDKKENINNNNQKKIDNNKTEKNDNIKKVMTKNTSNEELKKDDYIKILSLLKTPTFKEFAISLSVKEAIVICLKLGYVDGKYYETKEIATFLNIEEQEVREIVKNALIVYKEYFDSFVDKAIEKIK